ncbi:MAG TPA: hypothetical protein VKQ32_14845 [Polyangia bacterium]|nr:hypothetical protein [Polyangia bacterium]
MTSARGLITFLIVVAISGRAAAQTAGAPEPPRLGDTGHLTVSAERLFGFDYSSMSTSMNGMEVNSSSGTTFSVLGNPAAGLFTPASFPRVALDGFVARGFSVGAALAVFHYSMSSGTSDQTITGLQITPRVGYLARVTPTLAIWPRAGITYRHLSDDFTSQGTTESSSSFDGLLGSVEAPIVLTVVPRAAITFGPTFDIAFSGRSTSNSPGSSPTTTDEKLTEFGVQFGLLVLL